jgi:hypothetical protein
MLLPGRAPALEEEALLVVRPWGQRQRGQARADQSVVAAERPSHHHPISRVLLAQMADPLGVILDALSGVFVEAVNQYEGLTAVEEALQVVGQAGAQA